MKKSNVLFVAITGACGFLAYKYGKSFYTSLKNSKNRQPLEDIAKEIKETMIKNVDDIRKNTEELKEKVEVICNEAVNSMLEEEDFFFEVEEEKNDFVDTTYIEVPVKNIPVVDVEEQKKEEKVEETTEEKVEKVIEEKVELKVEENIESEEKSVVEEEVESKVEKTRKTKSSETEKVENKGIENLKKRQAAKNPRKKSVKAEEKSDEVKVEITEEKSE